MPAIASHTYAFPLLRGGEETKEIGVTRINVPDAPGSTQVSQRSVMETDQLELLRCVCNVVTRVIGRLGLCNSINVS